MRAPVGLCFLAAAFFLGRAARAEAPNAECSIRVIHALPEGDGVDARLARFRPYLQKPPFTSWRRFDVLDEKDVTLILKKPTNMSLPDGKTATLTYVEHHQKGEEPHRLEMRLQIESDKGTGRDTTFVLDAGGVVLQTAQKYQNGRLLLGFICDVHHDHP